MQGLGFGGGAVLVQEIGPPAVRNSLYGLLANGSHLELAIQVLTQPHHGHQRGTEAGVTLHRLPVLHTHFVLHRASVAPGGRTAIRRQCDSANQWYRLHFESYKLVSHLAYVKDCIE